MHLDAENGDDAGDEHKYESAKGDDGAAVELVRRPAADGAYARADEGAEERAVGE